MKVTATSFIINNGMPLVNSDMIQKRDNRLDSLKGFLIVLVILGHIIGNDNPDYINKCSRTIIYTFHMPLFILISGYLSTIKNNINAFWRGILNIAIPLLVFQSINLLSQFLIGNFNFSMLVIPYWTLWYLLSLIFWRLILQYSPQLLLSRPCLYLIIAIFVSVFSGLMPYGRVLSIQRTLNFYPFFLLGYYFKSCRFEKKLWNHYLSYGFIIITMLLIFFNLYPENSDLLLKGADQYNLSDIPSKIYMLLCSFFVSLSLYYVFVEYKVLTIVGRDSMFYYLYHGLIIQFALFPIISLLDLPNTFLFTILYCTIICVIIYLLSTIKLFRWIINPIRL